MSVVPLSVLDLAPVRAGGNARLALNETLDLARQAERLGYHRYWLAEHHLSGGLASSATPVVIGQVAAVTERIRVGSGATLLGYHTPLSVVESFGTLEALYPGRIDLGLGRGLAARERAHAFLAQAVEQAGPRIVRGVKVPAPPPMTPQRSLARDRLLQHPGAQPLSLAAAVETIFQLINGDYLFEDGSPAQAMPGVGADLDVWVLGSSAGESARVAAERGLPLAVNYHVSPATVFDAIEAYRSAFRPSPRLSRPYLMVSADVLVAENLAQARYLARPYAAWVHGIRSGQGAQPYPAPDTVDLSGIDPELVRDRLETQFLGDARGVAESLRVLQRATEADELLVTTNAYRHQDRLASFALLAGAWFAQGRHKDA
ncbi:MsnO8 family LLM class oxidoreductase [Bordetella avium]|uniref:MsnO8 family LLM class oxidoreductase n=1 Tax=Bordetella avium TaxID=521 RepID=UPI000E0C399E|nr:MsnO8 family LLM class oxidoreductase [Bordetella avium]AZY49197.1 LLM class flavin-dependent oxidoreductase [Bordetella avium]RIQ12345.1 MsnO8 family LLM class oxidoreductase [Bordetella avium]RIQ36063.1 MsnO8 family LLM class oxidoreductase [Bordetella avium]RIQ40108.1 MsnO8 family LLM class oxidoreductase [Bordetella avium]RIQ41728.1 MsnO8 family LLM class oxidoreductase [Bordetella avium]